MTKKRSKLAPLAVLSFAGLLGCASIGSPGGGLYDETPPALVRSEPAEAATSVNRQKITMRFNENIKLDNANEKMTISPPQVKAPTISSNAKTLTIELRDTLQANTTYTIDLGDAVQDNNEGNPLENLSLTFSTGDHIDTMKVMGTLLNAKDLEPVTGAFVGIYALNEDGIFPARGKEGDSLQLAIDSIVALYPDSIFSLRPFERAGKTDSYGRFTISGVGPGKYRMYAVKDGNTNYMYDVNTEDIAFVDSLIIPSVGSHTASDTIWNRFDSLKVDSIYVHEVTDYYPNDLCLRMFNEGHVIRYLDDMKWKDSTQITLNFAARMPEPPVISLLDEEDRGPARLDKDAWLICEPNPTNDTLVYWLRDSLVYHRDTLHLTVTYPFTQNGIDIIRTDTMHLEKPEINVPEDQHPEDKDDKKKKKRRKKDQEEAPQDTLPKTVFMSIKLLDSKIDVGKRPRFETSAPLDSLNTEALHLEQQKDTIWVPLDFELVQDSLRLRRYTLHAKPHFSPGQNYRLICDSASMFDIYGHPLDSIAMTFSEKKSDEYAHLLVNVQGVEGEAFVQLLNEKDNPVQQVSVKNGQARFPQAPVGKCYVRLVEDRNGNGIFDVGSLDGRIQPENVFYLPKMLEMRENWDYSETWNVRATELDKQKPDELKQNKPKEKKEKKSKNEEYLEKHPNLRKKLNK
ncbi:MAG: Ig-like domain-containing protein [Bacteroidales bacterium]|nr:Ig-like domain-containing protein [Bacteroidales bacterium]MBR3540700.1 Ig-like domain-containing protein [Bacteroidales bacterium]